MDNPRDMDCRIHNCNEVKQSAKVSAKTLLLLG